MMSGKRAGLPLLLVIGGMAGCEAPPPPAPPASPTSIELPAAVTFPEGVAFDEDAGTLYTGDAVNGALVQVDPASGSVTEIAPPGALVTGAETPFPAVLGMEIDPSNRLWVSGGRTGRIWVVNTADGSVLKDAAVGTEGSLINDVAVIGSSGYFTDTLVPILWRVTEEGGAFGDPEPWLDLAGSPISYGTGPNLNGIVATPDGGTLLVVHMGEGLLFAIDVATKEIRQIDTGGADLTGGDGLVLDGNTLYVIRQTAVEIATVELDEGMTTGTVVSRFTDPALAWPATAVKVGDELIVANSQFNTRSDNTTVFPFTLVRVPLALLSGG